MTKNNESDSKKTKDQKNDPIEIFPDGKIKVCKELFVYEGGWQEKPHGLGKMIFLDDKISWKEFSGNWENGKMTSGKLVYKNGDFYEGNFEGENQREIYKKYKICPRTIEDKKRKKDSELTSDIEERESGRVKIDYLINPDNPSSNPKNPLHPKKFKGDGKDI